MARLIRQRKCASAQTACSVGVESADLPEKLLTKPRRVAFLGNSLPRRCGIATFTTDLQQAIAATGATSDTAIAAMTDDGRQYDYPPVVRLQIHDQKIEEYEWAAHLLNAEQFDVLSLQHEFGIFGGDAGSHVLTLLAKVDMPIEIGRAHV